MPIFEAKPLKTQMDEYIENSFVKRDEPVHMLIGTDWWTDCDDVAAMRIYAWAQQKNLIKIEGIGINACMKYSVPSLNAYLTSENCGDIPIGLDKAATDYSGSPPFQKELVIYPHTRLSNDDSEDAVRLYRRVLVQAVGKIDIAEIGFPQVLSNLLQSPADDLSPYTGLELVTNKVNKLWMMAGNWTNPARGSEHNFTHGTRSRIAGNYVCDHWPTPITFLGWEVSNTVITGDTITSPNDLLLIAFHAHNSFSGRSSWDPMLSLLSCVQDENLAGYTTVRGTAHVDAATGINSFTIDPNGNHCYVKKFKPDTYYKDCINMILESREQF